jgi:hypothetical protein
LEFSALAVFETVGEEPYGSANIYRCEGWICPESQGIVRRKQIEEVGYNTESKTPEEKWVFGRRSICLIERVEAEQTHNQRFDLRGSGCRRKAVVL